MLFVLRNTFLFVLLFSAVMGYGQSYNLEGQWKSIGPNDIPHADKYQYAAGTGPIECIRISEKNPDFMLASSLNGGLFYTENAGEQWLNAGSDYWTYSACSWADFHPENENVWYGVMNVKGKNGKPGRVGKEGGVMRTTDKGISWEKIAGVEVFGSAYVEVFSLRFHPTKPNLLMVLTKSGLFYTNNALQEKVKWDKVKAYDGWIYDINFLNDKMYVSNFQFGDWHIYAVDQNNFEDAVKIDAFEELAGAKKYVTFESSYDSLLVLIDYTKKGDKLYGLNVGSGSLAELRGTQRVSFGNGHTFKVNPKNQSEMIVGSSTQIRYYDLEKMKMKRIGSDYHVDIEFVEFHPRDSGVIFLATHGGVWKSSNNGVSWEAKSTGLSVAEVMGLSTDPNNPERILIGCFHDGSSYLSPDSENYPNWEIVNGGDGLKPLFSKNGTIAYTSNQFSGGGLFISTDSLKTSTNIHSKNGLKTSGWELAYALHPEKENLLFFNYKIKKGDGEGNIDVVRTFNPTERSSAERISNFKESHELEKYKVYGLFNSVYRPNVLVAYVLHYAIDKQGKNITRHRLFINNNILDSANTTKDSWVELKMPFNNWLGGVSFHPTKPNWIYLSYLSGKDNSEYLLGEKGIIYAVKYKSSDEENKIKRKINIRRNVPNSIGGKYNICFIPGTDNLIMATHTGVYLGSKKVLKGKGAWISVGYGLPHCKIKGLEINEKEKIITVGLFGRGVWQYNF